MLLSGHFGLTDGSVVESLEITISGMSSHHLANLNRIGAPRLRDPKPRLKKSSGFSLIEVLVSVVILSFGLLGMAGMQAASLQSNREARLQSSAVVLARELAEMIRGNKLAGIQPAATNPYLGSFTSPLAATTPSYCLSVGATACTGATPLATATAIGNAQMTEWLARVDAELPGARVDVCVDSAPFDASGLPQWACTAAGGAVVLKIGWTRGSTNRSLSVTPAASAPSALERATIPGVVLPLIAGDAAV